MIRVRTSVRYASGSMSFNLLDFRLFANPTLPFIRTGRCVAAAPRLAILPTDGEDIRTAAEKPSEQGNLVFDCRIPIDEIAGFFRRDDFDNSGLLTRCRSQGLDLGYDRRTLAFQRSELRHEFGNSDVRSRHRRVWRVPAFFVSSLTNSTALGAASVRLRSIERRSKCGAAQSAVPSRDRALRRNAGVENQKDPGDIRNRAVHDATY
jgi:hypothetical protein